MTSDPTSAFVWAWLPGSANPVVAGRLDEVGEITYFTYGRSYLSRPDAIPLYAPELPLRPGRIRPEAGLTAAGCIRDAGPGAWGQRVTTSVRNPAEAEKRPKRWQFAEMATAIANSPDVFRRPLQEGA